ncbi:TPA: TonB-dependent hemoglobin/transferrin/lactoferrin family receptor, partial [Haemophilus influenzae]
SNLSEQLEQINVSGSTENSDSKTPPKIAETVKTAKTLEREQANNIKDIVKYETGVTVVEAGRFGQSGFAIRGVDENRVAINIDGLRQAETLSSQGFKELFEGYGNFNNTRNGAEIETLKEVNITKGANSIKSGSGSLGGSVIYKTKDARDYLLNKDYYVSYKKGYATENNQSFNTLTLAGRYKKFDALVVTTRRNGHELENYDYKNADSLTQGKKREKADPYKIEQDSTLLKFSFNPTENHRFTLAADLYEHRSRGQDLSYTLKYLKTLDLPEDDSRHTNDKTKRRNISFSYENFSQTPFWDTLKITFSKQKIKTRARTDEYCDAGVRYCAGTDNPAGLKLTDGKITRQDGSELQFEEIKNKTATANSEDKTYDFNRFIDTDNKVIEGKLTLGNADDTWYDCSRFDCEKDKTIQVFEGEYSYGHKGKWKKSELEIENLNGKKLARIKDRKDKNGRYNTKIKSILPYSPGYLERLWQERDLDTNTQQLNLDLTKDFKTWRVEHNLQYGSSYNTTMKRMVNRAGNDATDVQWWATPTLGKNIFDKPRTCEDSWKAHLCPRVDPEFSFLLPIKTKEKSVYLFDNVVITDYLSFDLGYRYDNIHYQPKYKHGVTPKLPDDIVKGLFIPLKSQKADDVKENVQQNIDYIAKQNKKYKAHSYSFASTIDPTSFLRLQLKYSKGFRAPTSDEMYFTFKHPDFTILPNTNLKPEIAKTKEIAFTLHHDDWGFISTSLFKTNYKNFIDLIFKGEQDFAVGGGGGRSLSFSLYQNINRDSAVVKGIEINSKVFLGKMAKFMDGFNLSYKYTYQKGRMDGNIPMNAIQPKTMVYGLGYDHPSQKFGFNFYTTHVASKNPEDTYDIYAKDKNQTNTSIKWRSKSYTILDLIGYVQPIKNLTIRAGVYNLTNRKYITWDSARSIRSFGTSNVIEQTTGLGINRFYAPGRNYKMSVQFEF